MGREEKQMAGVDRGTVGVMAESSKLHMGYAEETCFTIGKRIAADVPVILPVGAVEAHGPHLPLETDNLLAARYARRLAALVNGLVLPTLPFGQVFSLGDFPGSLSLSNETLTRIVVELGEGLYRQGVRIFVLFSAHLGNLTALKEGARELWARHRDMCTLHMFYPDLQKLAANVRESPAAHASYIHACEIETSLMLYLAPEHVDMAKALAEDPKLPIDADYTPTPWSEFTQTAVLGNAQLATEEKGRYLIEETLKRAAAIVEYEKERVHSVS